MKKIVSLKLLVKSSVDKHRIVVCPKTNIVIQANRNIASRCAHKGRIAHDQAAISTEYRPHRTIIQCLGLAEIDDTRQAHSGRRGVPHPASAFLPEKQQAEKDRDYNDRNDDSFGTS